MTIIAASACLAFLASFAARASEPGLVAHYAFDEERGDVAADSGGNQNPGAIRGAKWVAVAGGHALEFDGIDDCVDCGDSPSLDIRGPITTIAWICPAGRQIAHEPGILGKQFTSYLVTYYSNQHLYWYIGSGGNNAHATVQPGRWSHVATSFDGRSLKIYVNGALAAERALEMPAVPPGGRFFIGAVMGEPQASDTNYRVTGAFKGCIDEVKVYNRALEPKEIQAQFNPAELDERNAMFDVSCAPISAACKVARGDIAVAVSRSGALQVSRGQSFCVLESRFSCPGEKIGWNILSERPPDGPANWKPRVRKVGDSTLVVSARARDYALERTIRLAGGRVEIRDSLTNLRRAPVAVMVHHTLATPRPMTNSCAMNSAAIPLIFFSQPGADFGLVAEDDIGRLQFDSSCVANRADIRHSNFALDAGRAYTFRYAIYPIEPTGDVYRLVNRVRRDWKANFTIEGPFQFFDAVSPLLKDMQALKRFLQRKNLRVVALTPFLDYDPGSMDHVIPREEYRAVMRAAASSLRKARPGIKVLGCIECDWVNIVPDKMKDGHLISTGTAQQVAKVIADANLSWKDSTKCDRDGTVRIEYYQRGGKPQFSLGVYPAPGNYQHRFLVEQAKFILDDVGLDGFYIDEFSQAWGDTIRSYGGWDGFSVDVDPATGEIAQKFTDCGLAGIKPRLDIIRTALGRKRNITANTFSTSLAEQRLPAQRFAETQGSAHLDLLQPGKKPPFVGSIFAGVLGSPHRPGRAALSRPAGHCQGADAHHHLLPAPRPALLPLRLPRPARIRPRQRRIRPDQPHVPAHPHRTSRGLDQGQGKDRRRLLLRDRLEQAVCPRTHPLRYPRPPGRRGWQAARQPQERRPLARQGQH